MWLYFESSKNVVLPPPCLFDPFKVEWMTILRYFALLNSLGLNRRGKISWTHYIFPDLSIKIRPKTTVVVTLQAKRDRRSSSCSWTSSLLCNRYTCFLHYFALFGGLGLNDKAYRVTFGTFPILLTQNMCNGYTTRVVHHLHQLPLPVYAHHSLVLCNRYTCFG